MVIATLIIIPKEATALKRMQQAAAFFFTIPGPKMIWQFGELGFDYSIEYNGRVGNKRFVGITLKILKEGLCMMFIRI